MMRIGSVCRCLLVCAVVATASGSPAVGQPGEEPGAVPPGDLLFGEEMDVRVVNLEVVVDDDHTMVSFRRPVLRGFAAGLDQLGSGDRVAVVVQSRNRLEMLSPFTTDREATRAALAELDDSRRFGGYLTSGSRPTARRRAQPWRNWTTAGALAATSRPEGCTGSFSADEAVPLVTSLGLARCVILRPERWRTVMANGRSGMEVSTFPLASATDLDRSAR